MPVNLYREALLIPGSYYATPRSQVSIKRTSETYENICEKISFVGIMNRKFFGASITYIWSRDSLNLYGSSASYLVMSDASAKQCALHKGTMYKESIWILYNSTLPTLR